MNKYLILLVAPLLASCESYVLETKGGHSYVWVPEIVIPGHYVHSDECDRCLHNVQKSEHNSPFSPEY